MEDLFTDLSDGRLLIKLLEVLYTLHVYIYYSSISAGASAVMI